MGRDKTVAQSTDDTIISTQIKHKLFKKIVTNKNLKLILNLNYNLKLKCRMEMMIFQLLIMLN